MEMDWKGGRGGVDTVNVRAFLGHAVKIAVLVIEKI